MSKEAMKRAFELAREGVQIHNDNSPEYKVCAALLAIAEAEKQEPVAIVVASQYEDGSHAGNHLEWRGRNEANDFPEGTAFYTHPQPKREPLTDEQIGQIFRNLPANTPFSSAFDFARAIEAAHGIKE
jgi:hypothetical protein